jgi:hypothetical protein
MSYIEPAGQRLTRRSFLVAGFALATAIAAGCGQLSELIDRDPNESVYRSQVTPAEALVDEAFAATGSAFETRLRFLTGDGAAIRQVHGESGNFYLAEVPSSDVPQFASLVLTTGRVSLANAPADVALDQRIPAGAVVIVGDLRVDPETVRLDDPGTAPVLEFTIHGADATALAGATAIPNRALAVVVDGVVRFAAFVESPIPDGRVSIVSPERPEMLSAIGAILASGPLASDLVASADGQILFDR